MAKLQTSTKAGFNAGKKDDVKLFPIEAIKIDPEIAGLFKVSDKVLKQIQENIEKLGYYEEEPVVIWKGRNILVDGRTRYTASKNAKLNKIPVFEKEFKSRDEAIMYTFERQVLRRNLTGAEILTATKMIKGSRAAQILAEKLDISPAYIYQAKAILKDAPAEDIKAIKKGKKSIKKAYTELKERQKPEVEFDIHGLPEVVKFLKGAVTLLVESRHLEAADLLIKHYLKKGEKNGFYKLLSEKIRLQLLNLEYSTS